MDDSTNTSETDDIPTGPWLDRLKAAVNATEQTEIEKLQAQIYEIVDVDILILRCDFAGLSVKGSEEALRDRIIRYQVRKMFPRLPVPWDIMTDERRGFPFALTTVIENPGCLEEAYKTFGRPSPDLPFSPSKFPFGTAKPIPLDQSGIVELPRRVSLRRSSREITIPPLSPVPFNNSTSRETSVERSSRVPVKDPSSRETSVERSSPVSVKDSSSRETSVERSSPVPGKPPARRSSSGPNYEESAFIAVYDAKWTRNLKLIEHWLQFGPKFSGKPEEDVEDYLRCLQDHYKSIRLTEPMFLKVVLPVAFTGIARLWYRLERDNFFSYNTFVSCFRAQFGEVHPRSRMESKIHSCIQGVNESVGDYLVTMRTHFSHFDPPLSLEHQLNLCYKNLRPDISGSIYRKTIKSYADLLRTCRLIEYKNVNDTEDM